MKLKYLHRADMSLCVMGYISLLKALLVHEIRFKNHLGECVHVFRDALALQSITWQ